jgi:hypothetical protein
MKILSNTTIHEEFINLCFIAIHNGMDPNNFNFVTQLCFV